MCVYVVATATGSIQNMSIIHLDPIQRSNRFVISLYASLSLYLTDELRKANGEAKLRAELSYSGAKLQVTS